MRVCMFVRVCMRERMRRVREDYKSSLISFGGKKKYYSRRTLYHSLLSIVSESVLIFSPSVDYFCIEIYICVCIHLPCFFHTHAPLPFLSPPVDHHSFPIFFVLSLTRSLKLFSIVECLHNEINIFNGIPPPYPLRPTLVGRCNR